MKKKLILIIFMILSIFLVSGCEDKNKEEDKKEVKTNVEKQKDTYVKYVKELRKVKESTENLPFTVDVVYEKLDEEMRYQVIIDNPNEDITDVLALAIHDKQTNDTFPSIGIFDKKVNLIKDAKPSGVILVGYIPYDGKEEDFKCEMRVLITYKIGEEKFKGYYLTKK